MSYEKILPEKTFSKTDALKKCSNILAAIDNPVRMEIIKVLDEKKEMAVMDIVFHFRNPLWDQPVMSMHLGRLRRNCLVNLRIEGKFHYYSLNYDMFERVVDFINKINE